MTKLAGSGSISQRHGSEDPDPDPHQNVMDPEHCQIEAEMSIPDENENLSLISLKDRPPFQNFQIEDEMSIPDENENLCLIGL
jgi:hypothetical protein